MDTHGVSNMLRSYVQSYQKGDYNPRPNWRIVRESPSTATIDADGGLGIILGPKAMRIAMDKARNVGVGIVTMYNGAILAPSATTPCWQRKKTWSACAMTTPGRRAYFWRRTTLRDQSDVHCGASQKCPGLCFSMPPPARLPTTKSSLPPAWVSTCCPAGSRPGREPDHGRNSLQERGEYYLLPLGATELGSHKGYGLALMVEILSTLLSGTLPFGLDRSTGYKHYFAATTSQPLLT